MKRRHYGLGEFLILFLAFSMVACSGGIGGGDESGMKTADPYPVESVDSTERWETNLIFYPDSADYDELVSYIAGIFGNDSSDIPQCAQTALAGLQYLQSLAGSDGYLLVSPCDYKTVSDACFFEYTQWYEPNSTLSVTLSSVNETSVTKSLNVSIGSSLGIDASAFTASISMESSKTVTTANGIEVATTYDLTQYDQGSLYKVVLAGEYSCVRYHFRIQGLSSSVLSLLPSELNTDGNGYIGYVEGVKVNQDTLSVKLVHD